MDNGTDIGLNAELLINVFFEESPTDLDRPVHLHLESGGHVIEGSISRESALLVSAMFARAATHITTKEDAHVDSTIQVDAGEVESPSSTAATGFGARPPANVAGGRVRRRQKEVKN